MKKIRQTIRNRLNYFPGYIPNKENFYKNTHDLERLEVYLECSPWRSQQRYLKINATDRACKNANSNPTGKKTSRIRSCQRNRRRKHRCRKEVGTSSGVMTNPKNETTMLPPDQNHNHRPESPAAELLSCCQRQPGEWPPFIGLHVAETPANCAGSELQDPGSASAISRMQRSAPGLMCIRRVW